MVIKVRELMMIDNIGLERINLAYIQPVQGEYEDNESISLYLKGNANFCNSKNIVIDLNRLGFLSAIRFGVMALTLHFVNCPDGKIYLIVNDSYVKKSIQKLNFANALIMTSDQKYLLQKIA